MTIRATGKYDLVICDIDGCLSPESHAPINVSGLAKLAGHNRLAIQKLDRPVVTLCSGRPIGFVECLCRLIQNTLVPCIGENGVWLWRPTDNSFECDPDITDEHLDIRAKFVSRCDLSDEDPEDLMTSFLNEENAVEEFWQRVKTNLQAGRIRMT